jgi:hypothetical protein
VSKSCRSRSGTEGVRRKAGLDPGGLPPRLDPFRRQTDSHAWDTIPERAHRRIPKTLGRAGSTEDHRGSTITSVFTESAMKPVWWA